MFWHLNLHSLHADQCKYNCSCTLKSWHSNTAKHKSREMIVRACTWNRWIDVVAACSGSVQFLDWLGLQGENKTIQQRSSSSFFFRRPLWTVLAWAWTSACSWSSMGKRNQMCRVRHRGESLAKRITSHFFLQLPHLQNTQPRRETFSLPFNFYH